MHKPYAKLQLVIKYFTYWLTAANGKGHGIHSPFVFQFVTDILNDDRFFYAFETIEESLPSTSQHLSKKYNQLLFKIVNYYQPKTILTIDESFSNTTSYLALVSNDTQVLSYGQSIDLQKTTLQNGQLLGINNIVFHDNVSILESTNWDIVFINQPNETDLVKYVEIVVPKLHSQSVLIIKNIHSSKVMEDVWGNIKQQPSVTLSIDLFQLGLVFFRPENKMPQHFTIQF